MEALLPLLLIFAIMMLPMLWMSSRQRKAQAQQMERVNALGVGDEVRTHAGFFGLIVEEYDDYVILEDESGGQSKWLRRAIAARADEPVAPVLGAPGAAQPAAEAEQETPVAQDGADGSVAEPASNPEQPSVDGDRRGRGDVPGVTH